MNSALLSLLSLLFNLVLGGGLIAVLLKYKVQMRGEDRIDFDALLKEVTRQRDVALAQVGDLNQRIDNLEGEIQGLRIARDLDPFPNWVVDLQGCCRYVNREFEAFFLEPKRQTYRDVIGKHREEIWPPEFCKVLSTLDDAARKRPDGTARAKSRLSLPNLGECDVTVHKFPIRFKGAIVSFAGYITSIDPVERYTG